MFNGVADVALSDFGLSGSELAVAGLPAPFRVFESIYGELPNINYGIPQPRVQHTFAVYIPIEVIQDKMKRMYPDKRMDPEVLGPTSWNYYGFQAFHDLFGIGCKLHCAVNGTNVVRYNGMDVPVAEPNGRRYMGIISEHVNPIFPHGFMYIKCVVSGVAIIRMPFETCSDIKFITRYGHWPDPNTTNLRPTDTDPYYYARVHIDV